MKKFLLIIFLLPFLGFAQTTGDYRSAVTGNWTSLTSWERYNGTTWVTPTTGQGYPGQNAGTGAILIQAGHTITMGTSGLSTSSIASLTINGTLNLTAGSSGSTFSINTPLLVVTPGLTPYAQINFDNKVTLNLPANVSMQVSTGGLPTPGDGTCTANIQISIGSTPYAYCTGNGQVTHFDEIMAAGGYNTAGTLSGNQYLCLWNTSQFNSTTPGGTWSSSNTSIATVSTTGLVTAVSQGDATITYTKSGKTATRNIYVANNGGGGGVTAINGSNSQCQGSTANYTITSASANYNHTWSYSGTGVTFVTSADGRSATATFAPNATTGTQQITVYSTNGCGTGYGINMNVTVAATSNGGNVSTTAISSCSTPYYIDRLNLSGFIGSILRWESSTVSDFSSGVVSISDGGNGINIGNLTQTTYYRAVVQNLPCTNIAYSNVCTVTISSAPPTGSVGAITGTPTVCLGQTGISYSVSPVAGATGYNWNLPSGATIASGANTNSITVNFSTLANSGNITVQGTNACGTGTSSSNFAVTVAPTATISYGGSPYCKSLTTASVTQTGTSGGVYSSSAGLTINASTGVITPSTSTAGTYTVTYTYGSGGCTGLTTTTSVTISDVPSAPTVGVITHPTCSILTGSVDLSGLPATGTWTISATPVTLGLTGLTGTNSSTTTIKGLTGGATYRFTITPQGGCASTASSNVVIGAPPVIATWNGSWSFAPTSSTRVEFIKDYNSPSSIDACSCYVKNNAEVTFNSGHTLNVVNEVQVETGTNAKLIFENDASLVQVNDAAINSGSITYKRNTYVNRYDYTYWSSPVANWKLKDLSYYTLFDRYFSYNDGWVLSYNGQDEMVAGHGYIVRAPQPYAISGVSQLFEGIFKGIPNNGIINGGDLAVVAGKDYLLGNPYPSAIDADKFLDLNSTRLQGTLYFWTHNTPPVAAPGTTSYKYTASDYASYNRTGGVTTSKVAAATGGLPPNGKIGAGQGFFAPAIGGGNVLFNNSMRIVGGTNGENNLQFFKLSTSSKTTTAANTEEKSRVWLNLTNTEGVFKQVLVGYVAGATNEYDNGFDGLTYNGNQYVDFYSVNNETNLVIQGRALPFVKKDSVALGYNTTIKGEFQISIDHTDGALATQNIFLEDKDLKVLHDLKKEAYIFSTEKGAFNDRFVLRYVDKNAVEEVPEIPQELNKDVLVSVQNGIIKIDSPVELLDKVVVYDSAGRKLFQKNKVAVNVFFIQHLISSHQVLVVDIQLSNGKKISRKIVY